MPTNIVSIKRLLLLLFVSLTVWLLFTKSTSLPISTKQKHYKLRHNYTLRNQPDSYRHDLQPKLVYRGSNKDIDPDDIGLVRSAEDKKLRETGYKNFAFNTLVSRRIGLHRELPDTRNELCKTRTFPKVLPSASVIICFYNEDLTTLSRTVHSVLDRSPHHLLHEILLVNDYSDLVSREEIDTELKSTAISDSGVDVRLVNTPRRLGLIRARVFGARNTTGLHK